MRSGAGGMSIRTASKTRMKARYDSLKKQRASACKKVFHRIVVKFVDTADGMLSIRTRWGDALAVLTGWLRGAELDLSFLHYFLVFLKLSTTDMLWQIGCRLFEAANDTLY